MSDKLRLEVWTSSQQRQERHYFLHGTSSGYQEGIYLFGVNPLRVTEEQEQEILRLLGYKEEVS
jgi:hypothetical protein